MWYYSLNDQQAGPISQAELVQMLNETLPSDTMVWQDGMSEWLPAQDVDAFRNIEASYYAVPNSTADQNMQLSGTEEIPAEPIPLDIGFCVSRAWRTTSGSFGTIFLTWFVYIFLIVIVDVVLSIIGSAIDGPSVVAPITEGMTLSGAFLESYSQRQQGGVAYIIASILSQTFMWFLGLGLTFIGLNLLRGRDANVGQLFGQSGAKLLKVIGASFLYGLMVGLGFFCFIIPAIYLEVTSVIYLGIIPGIYLATRFMFYQTAIVDKDLGVIDSLKYSSALTRDNKWRLIGLTILNTLIVIAGFFALFVGLIWAIPVAWLSLLMASLYLHNGERSPAT